MKNKTAAVLLAVALVTGFLAGLLAHSRYQARHTPEPRVDTVYVARSAAVTSPAPVDSARRPDLPPAVIPSDRILPSPDSSAAVLVEKETLTYRDTLAKGVVATAVITGIQPSLDHLQITWPETTVTRTNYKPLDGWALGLSASGAYATTSFVTGSFTLSYTAGPARFRLDAGVLYQPRMEPRLSPYVGGGVEITLFRFRRR